MLHRDIATTWATVRKVMFKLR